MSHPQRVVCARVFVRVPGGWEEVKAPNYPTLLCVFSHLSPFVTRLDGWRRAQGCGLSEHSDILALCREPEVALGIVKQCKGDVYWQCRCLD